jgi:2'-5' RNA ligase
MSSGKRLFVALSLPVQLLAVIDALNPRLPGVHWTKPGNFHLTLEFLGNVAEEAQCDLERSLSTVSAPVFDLEIRGVGTFGGRRPEVLWAGLGKGREELLSLHTQVSQAIRAAGLIGDHKAYHPHVTLARLRDVDASVIEPFLLRHATISLAPFPSRLSSCTRVN